MNKFSFDTISDFDNHISSSILGYDLLYTIILNLVDFYISSGLVYDLGCTTGKLLENLKNTYQADCVGYDISSSNFIDVDYLKVVDISLADFDLTNADVVLSVFTLQFIDARKREGILSHIYNNLSISGCFIFCEKERSVFDHKYEFANYQNKRNHFTAEDILEKEKSLRTVMHPLRADQNKKMLTDCGFTYDIFFKSLNYTGYICTK